MNVIKRPHWSFSSVNQYRRCSLQFYFERIAKIPRKTISSSLVFGSAIHDALAAHHTSVSDTDGVPFVESGWVGKVISKIGKKAKIEVATEDKVTGLPAKFASAHDLRRSCGQRLRNAGVPPLVICRVMRHSSWETTRRHYAPGDIQREAEILRQTLLSE